LTLTFSGTFAQASDDADLVCKDCGDFKFDLILKCPACTNHFHEWAALKVHFDNLKDMELHQVCNPFLELSNLELADFLENTVKRDNTSKLITFYNMLNAQTENEQFNVMFSAESSTGKSYIALEISKYFPLAELVELAGASPTSMIHESGVEVVEKDGMWKALADVLAPYDKELEDIMFQPGRRTLAATKRITELKRMKHNIIKYAKTIVDYEGKILIFLDQPNSMLLSRIRPFLSHDKKDLQFHITDKAMRGGNKTKDVLLRGFCSVFFCTTSAKYDEQEATRNFVLSPESDQDKIQDALELLNEKLTNREKFYEFLENNPKRKALMYRIELIRAYGVRRFKLYDKQAVLTKFAEIHGSNKKSRHARDYTRIFNLIYGHALLNCFARELVDTQLIATQEDVEQGFELYSDIMAANESGVPPEIYKMFLEIFVPYYNSHATTNPEYSGMTSKDFSKAIYEHQHRNIPRKRVVEEIIPSLVASSWLEEDHDPNDKRISVYVPKANLEAAQVVQKGNLDVFGVITQ
jgi:hypothetical protein